MHRRPVEPDLAAREAVRRRDSGHELVAEQAKTERDGASVGIPEAQVTVAPGDGRIRAEGRDALGIVMGATL